MDCAIDRELAAGLGILVAAEERAVRPEKKKEKGKTRTSAAPAFLLSRASGLLLKCLTAAIGSPGITLWR